MLNKDLQNIIDIKESIEKIIDYTKHINKLKDFEENSLVKDAVLMNFVSIGESVARLSDDFRDKYGNISWSSIKGLRNIIAHDYFGIDIEEIWQIVCSKLPALNSDISEILKNQI
ncbi:MAG: DUF86 domain-containing protein [Spirochaetales bacterium]|nr:DUF86 domain-containing protein [Spirochaetales bacterium]